MTTSQYIEKASSPFFYFNPVEAKDPISPRLLLLVQTGGDLSASRMVNALATYWKFDYSVYKHGDNEHFTDHRGCTHLLIHYNEKDTDFEEWCANIASQLFDSGVLLIDNRTKEYGDRLQSIFGVKGINAANGNGKCLLKVVSDNEPILSDVEEPISLQFIGKDAPNSVEPIHSRKLLIDRFGSCYLSGMHKNYCLSVPVWQFGTPGFSHLFRILRNFLYFADGRGHFSPYPYVSLRIDDFPLTSEQFLKSGGVSDEERNREVQTLCEWSEEFHARLEFMVNSKVMGRDGTLTAIDKLVPKSISTLRSYFDRKVVNVNAHGRSHVDEECFRATRKVSPFEFQSLVANETEEHLKDCIDFIWRQFGKMATGFVPPCWGYREHLTKVQCRELFSFVIDSAANYQKGSDWPSKGFIDNSGMLHLLESWHLGSSNFDHTDQSIWNSYIGCGIPIQMMAHGLYLSEPIPSERLARWLVLGLYVALLPFIALLRPGELLRIFSAVISKRSWDRLGLLRKILVKFPGFKKSSVRNLLQTGTALGARWSFTEDLARYLSAYAGLTLNKYFMDDALHCIEFSLEKDVEGSFLFHLSNPSDAVELDGSPLALDAASTVLELVGLKCGRHTLTVRMK